MQTKSDKKIALVGHTGFIGSNLKSFYKSKYNFNSKNIKFVNNNKYDLVVLCAPSSKMWIANKYPKKDHNNIKNLINILKKTVTKKIILISTIEVYGTNNNKNELDIPKKESNISYGKNRLLLEEFVKFSFADHLIVRLPIVYGINFSKNCIYDLINKNNINLLNGNDLIQIYNIKNLKKDINYCLNKKIKLVNISSRPIKLKDIAKNFFNIELNLYKKSRSMLMQTSILKKKKYFHSHTKTLQDLKNFLKNK